MHAGSGGKIRYAMYRHLCVCVCVCGAYDNQSTIDGVRELVPRAARVGHNKCTEKLNRLCAQIVQIIHKIYALFCAEICQFD